jgi:hypothetical protein
MTTDVRACGNLWMLSMNQAVEKVEASVRSKWPTFEFHAAWTGLYQLGITLSWPREPDAPAADAVLEHARISLIGNCDIDGNQFRLLCDHVYPLGALTAALIDEWAHGRIRSPQGGSCVYSFQKSPTSYQFEDLGPTAQQFAHAIWQLAGVTKQDYARAHHDKTITQLQDKLARTLVESGEAVAAAVGHHLAAPSAP